MAGEASYAEVQDTIWGPEAVRRARVETIPLAETTTLGNLAAEKHGARRFWPLLAAINKDRGYFRISEASANTQIPAGAVMEIWHPSRFYGTTTETRVRVAGPIKIAAYDEIITLIESGAQWDEDVTFADLEQGFRKSELALHFSAAARNGARTLRELSLKYYGSAAYWPLIAWVNENAFGTDASGSTPLPDKQLYVIHFLP